MAQSVLVMSVVDCACYMYTERAKALKNKTSRLCLQSFLNHTTWPGPHERAGSCLHHSPSSALAQHPPLGASAERHT